MFHFYPPSPNEAVNLTPTLYPVNLTPTLYPVNLTPTLYPVNLTPTLYPVNLTPTLYPVNLTPTLYPVNLTPTLYPVNLTPTLYPVNLTPTLYPVNLTPTLYPVNLTPTLYPVNLTPTLYPYGRKDVQVGYNAAPQNEPHHYGQPRTGNNGVPPTEVPQSNPYNSPYGASPQSPPYGASQQSPPFGASQQTPPYGSNQREEPTYNNGSAPYNYSSSPQSEDSQGPYGGGGSYTTTSPDEDKQPSRSAGESADTSKKTIRTRYLGHVTVYQPIRDQYFLIRSIALAKEGLLQTLEFPHNHPEKIEYSRTPIYRDARGKGFCQVNRGARYIGVKYRKFPILGEVDPPGKSGFRNPKPTTLHPDRIIMSDPAEHAANTEEYNEMRNAISAMSGCLTSTFVFSGLGGGIANKIAKNAIAGSSSSPLKKYQSIVSLGVGLTTFSISFRMLRTPICKSMVESVPPSETKDILLKRLNGQLSQKEYQEKLSAKFQMLEEYKNSAFTKVVDQGGEVPQFSGPYQPFVPSGEGESDVSPPAPYYGRKDDQVGYNAVPQNEPHQGYNAAPQNEPHHYGQPRSGNNGVPPTEVPQSNPYNSPYGASQQSPPYGSKPPYASNQGQEPSYNNRSAPYNYSSQATTEDSQGPYGGGGSYTSQTSDEDKQPARSAGGGGYFGRPRARFTPPGEPTDTSKQPIITRNSGHVTVYQPIRDQYFLIRSVHGYHKR
eukprot:sb/3462528/